LVIVEKIWAPLRKFSLLLGSQAGYGPAGNPINIRFVVKTSDIRNFYEKIRSDVETSEVAALAVTYFTTV